MEEMQKKIDYYKDKSDRLEELQTHNNELEKQLIRAKVNISTEVQQATIKLQESFDNKLEDLQDKHSKVIDALKKKYGHELRQKEKDYTESKSTNPITENYDRIIESYKNEQKVTSPSSYLVISFVHMLR